MRNKQILKLAAGFRRFREKYFLKEDSIYARLSTDGQSPKTLIIGCSDSRVDPALMTSASPGEMFVVRNVANLVPPYEASGKSRHGVSAAIEFAVENLKVETIMILGHRQCGGIRALVTGSHNKGSFIGPWVGIAKDARERVIAAHPEADVDTLCRHCEMEAMITSMQNLKTFPFVRTAIENRGLEILCIYFDLEQGQLLEYNESNNSFTQIEIGK